MLGNRVTRRLFLTIAAAVFTLALAPPAPTPAGGKDKEEGFVQLFDGKSLKGWTANGKELVNYTEPKDKKAGEDFTRKLDEGTVALQAHDPDSEVHFKNIRVKRLPD
jgi:hypothetical protein